MVIKRKKKRRRKLACDLLHRNECRNREIWFHLWKKLKRNFFFIRRSLFLLKKAGSLESTDNKSSISRSIFTLAKHPPQSFCSYSWTGKRKKRSSLILNLVKKKSRLNVWDIIKSESFLISKNFQTRSLPSLNNTKDDYINLIKPMRE